MIKRLGRPPPGERRMGASERRRRFGGGIHNMHYWWWWWDSVYCLLCIMPCLREHIIREWTESIVIRCLMPSRPIHCSVAGPSPSALPHFYGHIRNQLGLYISGAMGPLWHCDRHLLHGQTVVDAKKCCDNIRGSFCLKCGVSSRWQL